MVVEYIIPATILASSIAMLYSSYRLASPSDKKISKISHEYSYRSQVKELELRREVVKTAILNVYKQYEEGKISEELKEVLIRKFEEELDQIDSKLAALKEYAELEALKEEYNRLLKEYESKRRELESRISELERKLKPPKKEKKEEKVEEREEKKKQQQRKKEDTLDEILKEVSKIIEEYGVE